MGLSLVDELTLHLLLHAAHHWVLSLHILRVHHDWLGIAGSLHHHGLTVLLRGHLLLILSLHWWHHLLRGPDRCQLDFQGAAEVRIANVVKHDVHVILAEASLVDEVLNCEHVQSHLLSLLQEVLLRLGVVAGQVQRADRLPHGHLVLDLSSLSFRPWHRGNTPLPHVADKLSRQLI